MNVGNEMVDPNRPYTVGCRLAHLVPDRTHAAAIEDAVTRVHRTTFLATELANLLGSTAIETERPTLGPTSSGSSKAKGPYGR